MNSTKTKTLIAYFSHSGNTRTVAQQIQKITGGDLFEIAAEKPYPRDYNTVVEVAKREQSANQRPPLKTIVENMAGYNVVILGYPNWWSTMPMPVFTFLEQYDFSGKTILPYCTHEGSRMGRSEKDIALLCPAATVLSGLAIRGSSVKAAQAEVAEWLLKAKIHA
jgi:flavodoxin